MNSCALRNAYVFSKVCYAGRYYDVLEPSDRCESPEYIF